MWQAVVGGAHDEDAGFAGGQGRVVQVDPMKPKLKPPGSKRLKLKCGVLLSNFAFKFNLRRYTKDQLYQQVISTTSIEVGRCRLTLSNPC